MSTVDRSAPTSPTARNTDAARGDDRRGNIFSRALKRLASSNEELESEDLQRTVRETGSMPIKSCADRALVTLTGTICTVTINPRCGSPSLEVELRDGSGTVSLVWLGRRRIPGIDPGRSISVTGRISCHKGLRTLYNPKYELLDGTS